MNGLSIYHPAILNDFFGDEPSDEEYRIIYGLYEGLIKFKGISEEVLYDCFITNRLDELIHKKYTFQPSKYYKEFCDHNIVIGETFYVLSSDDDDEDEVQKEEILTDDFCPTCSSDGFYTKKNIISDNVPDCFYCHKTMCKMCKIKNTVETVGETKEIYHCNRCTL